MLIKNQKLSISCGFDIHVSEYNGWYLINEISLKFNI